MKVLKIGQYVRVKQKGVYKDGRIVRFKLDKVKVAFDESNGTSLKYSNWFSLEELDFTKKKLFCSFSSGLSSAMMAKILLDEYTDEYDIIFGFANTGLENEKSLEFAKKCDEYFKLNLVYIEAEINPEKGKGTRHTVKTFDTLTRGNRLFEEGVKKYGIPNVANKWCNRELKLNAIHSYLRSIGWGKFGGDYYTAIGIRADEIDRISKHRIKNKLIYPLVEKGITSEDRNKFWASMPFTLDLAGYEGNCTMCFEKTMRKLATIYKLNPQLIKPWEDLEEKYSHVKIDGKPNYNSRENNFFLRDNRPLEDIKTMSKTDFELATDEYLFVDDYLDKSGVCDSGCNIFDLEDELDFE